MSVRDLRPKGLIPLAPGHPAKSEPDPGQQDIIPPRQETMKIRLIAALLGLAISFAVPTAAQEKEEVNPFPFRAIAAGPQIIQQLEAINLKFDEAFNKHDATAIGGALHPKRGPSDTGGVVFGSRSHRGICHRFVSASQSYR
jgi:hypothetical protein